MPMRDDPDAPVVVRLRALILRADLAIRVGDDASAHTSLDKIAGIGLTDDERRATKDDLRRARDLTEELTRR